VLATTRTLLNPGGLLILTVPAFMFLWGPQDRVSNHYRRYTRKHLTRQLKKAGFTLRRITYFNSLLFLPIALFRLLRPTHHTDSDFTISLGMVDHLLYHVFRSEQLLLPHINMPVGISLFVIAQKPIIP